jgi:NAD(P)H-dependent FMN reductase
MSERLKILALAGSARRDSFNKKLVRAAAAGASAAGADATVVDLREFPLPIYDGDLESEGGLPPAAIRLKELFNGADGLLISTPEYNGSIPALLKNTIDWVSRSPQATPDLAPYQGKSVGLLAASPGALGGLRALTHFRSLLSKKSPRSLRRCG